MYRPLITAREPKSLISCESAGFVHQMCQPLNRQSLSGADGQRAKSVIL